MNQIPELRAYQSRLVEEVQLAFDLGFTAPLVVLSTGGGKTIIVSQVALEWVLAGLTVWVIAHRKELLSQASRTLTKFGIPHGPGDPVTVISMQTLVRRMDSMKAPDLIILDEAQHSPCNTMKRVYEKFPAARRLGVTATPCRLNGAGLGSVFDIMLLGPTNAWLTKEGFLSPVKYYAPPVKANLADLKKQAGDYSVAQATEEMDKPTVTGDAITHYREICDGATMLAFCTSVEHAKHVAEQYRAAGYRAAAVDGNLSDEERDDRIWGLGKKYQIITSCDLIGEGLDVPSVSAVQLLRPTASLGLHLQQIGRGLRLDGPDKILKVLDHVGNVGSMVNGRWVVKHGFAATDHAWTLDPGKKVQQGKAPATRTCEQCFSVHLAKPACPYCGFIYPVKERTFSAMKMVDGTLVEVQQTAEEQKQEVKNAKTMGELIAIARARKYKKPFYWALQVFKNRPIDISDLP